MLTDPQGNALSSATVEAVELFNEAADAFSIYRGDPVGTENKSAVAIRHARHAEIPAIRAMQECSLLVLGGAYYAPDVIAAFLTEIGTMDDAVVHEGHYFVAENADRSILASGGWSRKTPGYDRAAISGVTGGNGADAATVRSVFVAPAAARRGIATAIMERIEQDAAVHGIGALSMMSTLSGLSFYARLGYQAEGEKTVALPGGLRFECITMSKTLACDALCAASQRRGERSELQSTQVGVIGEVEFAETAQLGARSCPSPVVG